ncbi:hypothetical protein LP415_23320 [Polaromonas sp. P1(28)-8]|nr:hypothetical protein LP415_23320 [Polaromonas sp. P1(28)-8]
MIQPELSGGKITRSEIDALLSRGASIVTVSGLDQDTFEYMVRRYGEQLVALHFWKCPRIDDFSPLEGVGKLTFAAFYWNQKATRFWNFSRTPSLSGLFFENFKKVEDLADLADASSLRELEFGNGFTGRSVVHSLEPLARLKALRSLAINPSRVLEGGIFPLASLVSLTDLSFSQRLFPVEQIAWLRASSSHLAVRSINAHEAGPHQGGQTAGRPIRQRKGWAASQRGQRRRSRSSFCGSVRGACSDVPRQSRIEARSMRLNMALNLAPFGRWTLRDKAMRSAGHFYVRQHAQQHGSDRNHCCFWGVRQSGVGALEK